MMFLSVPREIFGCVYIMTKEIRVQLVIPERGRQRKRFFPNFGETGRKHKKGLLVSVRGGLVACMKSKR